MNIRTYKHTDRLTKEHADGQKDTQPAEEHMDRKTNRQTNRGTYGQREIQTDRERNIRTDRQSDRGKYGQTDRQTD